MICLTNCMNWDIAQQRGKVTVQAFICDAQARAFLKCITTHTGLHGCERCVAVASKVQVRVIYLNKGISEKCTDEKFNQLDYAQHQKDLSLLVQIGIKCVSQFLLDHVHLMFLGAAKRLLIFLLQSPSICKFKKNRGICIESEANTTEGCHACGICKSATVLGRTRSLESNRAPAILAGQDHQC